MPATKPSRRYVQVPFGGILNESYTLSKVPGLTTAQNVMYRRFGSWGKRAGSAPYGGSGGVIGANAVKSGVRWSRGRPSTLRQMIVQSGDALYTGNDSNGAMTLLSSLAGGSSSAFYASVYDPAESGVAGTPASDVLVVAYGSGPPYKYDGTNFTQLNSSITNNFTGVVFWHEHLWFWGDSNNPDTVFATDLGAPESYTFSSTFGGYSIGRGDGDPTVQCCIPIGNVLYVFKARSIYAITGYDFQSGDYQFAVSPVVSGIGIPSPKAVTRLRNALVFWSGQAFYRLSAGSLDPEPIGRTIPMTSAAIANGNQNLIQAVAGDFLVSALVGQQSYTNVALFAVDIGTGVADTVLAYDDDYSAIVGDYAWTKWNGFTVGAWIPWGGPGDQKLLYFGDAQTGQVYEYGSNATADVRASQTNPINVAVATGRQDCGTPDLMKELHAIYLELEANAATFVLTATSDVGVSPAQNQPTTSGAVGGRLGSVHLNVDAFLGGSSGTSYQALRARINPSLRGRNYTLSVTESSTSSFYELVGSTLDFIEETYLS